MSNIFDPIDPKNLPERLRFTPKPHLERRLEESFLHLSSDRSGYLVDNDGDGKLKFIPDWFTLDCDGNPVLKEKKTEPEEESELTHDAKTGVIGTKRTLQVGDRVEILFDCWCKGKTGVVTEHTRTGYIKVTFDAGQGGLVSPYTMWDASEALNYMKLIEPTFDPMTEPLQVGDIVEVVYPDTYQTGKRGRVTHIGRPDDKYNMACGVQALDGESLAEWDYRSSLKLISRP